VGVLGGGDRKALGMVKESLRTELSRNPLQFKPLEFDGFRICSKLS